MIPPATRRKNLNVPSSIKSQLSEESIQSELDYTQQVILALKDELRRDTQETKQGKILLIDIDETDQSQINMQMPVDLWARVKTRCEESGVQLKDILNIALLRWLDKDGSIEKMLVEGTQNQYSKSGPGVSQLASAIAKEIKKQESGTGLHLDLSQDQVSNLNELVVNFGFESASSALEHLAKLLVESPSSAEALLLKKDSRKRIDPVAKRISSRFERETGHTFPSDLQEKLSNRVTREVTQG